MAASMAATQSGTCKDMVVKKQEVRLAQVVLSQICTGGPARTDLRSGWSWPWPRAEISIPEHHPCPCLGFFRTHG
jgi:hypothetical protein